MTTGTPSRTLRHAIVTIAVLSASLLAYQVLLTRVCALRLHFHFGFLIISNSLLGIGASGSLLALFERRWRLDPEAWIRRFGIGYLLVLPLCWVWLLKAQIPETLTLISFGDLWTLMQQKWSVPDAAGAGIDVKLLQQWSDTKAFAAFNFACAIPFFFGGTAVGLILAANAARIGTVYAADLVGAGLGCLLCPTLLWHVGAGGCFLATFVLGAIAVLASAGTGPVLRLVMAVVSVVALLWMPFLDRQFPVPGKRWLNITSKQTIDQFGLPLFTQWSANSRIDVLPMPPGWPGFLQARGGKAMQMPLPQQRWIGQDGDAGTMLSNFGGQPETLPVLGQTMYSASFALKKAQKPRVCVIGVGGAPDLWAARYNDASRILGIELNQAIANLHDGVAKDYSGPLFADPRVELRVDEGRSALMRSDEQFDVVQLTGIDTWTALSSGAYVLAENYLYTVEACRAMYARLAPGGILQITRMAAGMETIRLMNNMYAALPAAEQAQFADSIAALRTADNLCAVMLKKGAYSKDEVAALVKFADEAQIDKVAIPGTKLGTEVEEFVQEKDKQRFVDAYEKDISPTTDDRPYFFSFLRWNKPEVARNFLHEPTWVVQGNPLFLRNQLIWSSLAAALFILLPLVFRRGATATSRHGAFRFLLYFAVLGVAFIGIEVALIQKFTLLLGQPLYSIVVTLFSILVSTGIGAAVSARFLRKQGMPRLLPVLILAAVTAIAYGSPVIVDACISLPLALRALVVALAIAPVGMLLGMPFAYGIQVVERVNPSFVPWAWAVNGSTTVIGSISTVILSMNFGFAAVLVLSAALYLIAFAAIASLARGAAEPAGPMHESLSSR